MKRILLYALAGAWVCFGGTGARSQSVPAAEQFPFTAAENMSVLILSAPRNSIPVAVGSGVWIGKQGYVATCQHVIAASPGPFKIGIALPPYFAEGPMNIVIAQSIRSFDADIVGSDADTDVAILKAHTAPGDIVVGPVVTGSAPPSITPQTRLTPAGAALDTSLPIAGTSLLLAGFPLGQNTLIFQVGMMTGFWPASPITTASPPSNGLRMVLSLESNPGHSGGPILNAKGYVVGLLEGNLTSKIQSDTAGNLELCAWAKVGVDGQLVKDPTSGQLQTRIDYCVQNSGISLVVPARFITALAAKNKITLDQ